VRSDQTEQEVGLLVTQKRRCKGIVSTSVGVRMQKHTKKI